MLFYIKKFVWLDAMVTVFLAALGYGGMVYFEVPFLFQFTGKAVAQGIIGFALISGWTFLVQKGYSRIKGEAYAEALTNSLAVHYSGGSILQAFAGGLTAACGEELFFRGFLQGKWGILAASFIFGLAHFGKKSIRIVSYWSFGHGILFGLTYLLSGNLLAPMLAHGLFDLGGILYFQKRGVFPPR